MEYSIKIEMIAMIILVILFIYHWDRQSRSSTRYQLFTCGLLSSMGMIVLDIACTLVLGKMGIVPDWVNMVLNTGYFIVLDLSFRLLQFIAFILCLNTLQTGIVFT